MKKILFAVIVLTSMLNISAHAADYHEARPFTNTKPNYNTNYSANNYYQTRYDRGAFYGHKDKYKFWKEKQNYVEGAGAASQNSESLSENY